MSDNIQGWIYKITNTVNGKVYVGQTTEEKVSRRWNSGHRTPLKNNKHKNKHLQAAWNKYGEAAFKFEVIEEFVSEMNFDLNKIEKYWIKHFDSMNSSKGYNKTDGGANGRHSDETKKKMSELKKGMYLGENNPMYGTTSFWKGKVGPNKGKQAANRRKVMCLNTNKIYNSITEAAKDLNLLDSSISTVCSCKRNHTGGFKFQYLENKKAA